jgi:predicted aspartyl protease
VVRLRASRDYFALRERAERTAGARTPAARYARALVQHAFNEPAASNATVVALLADAALPDSVAADLRKIRVANHLRLFEYAAGLAAVDALLADTTTADTAGRRDVRNTRRIFQALTAVPRQMAESRGPTELRLRDGRVPVKVNDSTRHYVFDTGANLSTIMRSEARAVGLRIIPAGLDVGTSTDQRVVADVGVAARLVIGQVHFRHVVFLVLDDALLTFSDGYRIPGIVGFPVIEQMGEVRLGAGGELSVPAVVPRRAQRNLAFHELTPLTRVGWGNVPLLCRLDTGASRTQLYEPFYRRARAHVNAVARPTTRRMGGAGGERELAVRVLPDVRLAVGDTVATLDSADVLPQSIVRDASENYLDCNLGHDVLDAFRSYVLNFRDMAFVLR